MNAPSNAFQILLLKLVFLIPFNVRRADYEELKAIVDKAGGPMNSYIKKALNAYTGQEIFKA